MIGLFLFGCFITAIVATACALIVSGIRADKRQLDSYDDDSPENVRI